MTRYKKKWSGEADAKLQDWNIYYSDGIEEYTTSVIGFLSAIGGIREHIPVCASKTIL